LVLDPDYQPGYRVGGSFAMGDRSSVRLTYAALQAETTNGGDVTADDILANRSQFPLLLHPVTLTPDLAANITALGRMDVDFQIADLDARMLLWDTQTAGINAFGGVRWVNMNQDVVVGYLGNAGTVVEGGIQHDGLGAHLGLDGQFRSATGFGAYGLGALSLIYGMGRGDFVQYPLNDRENPQAATAAEYDRLTPMLDLEMGVDWVSSGGNLRFAAGYLTNVWFNVITARDYFAGIRENQFDDFSDTMTFDGLTARAEVLW
jgi:hypothetical protein